MAMYFSLIWRNIWRNKRRSILSITSVLFAVLIALVMRSMQLGFYAQAISNVVSFHTGYIQIHAPGYNDEMSVDRSFAASDSLLTLVEDTDGVTFSAPRMETFALISAGKVTDGAMVVGVDPEREDRLTGLAAKVVEGSYLITGDSGILLAKGLADHLKMAVGDTVVVLGQGYHGMMAAGKFRVIGVVEFPTPELNSGLSFITVKACQELTGAYGRLTSLALMLSGQDRLAPVTEHLRKVLGDSFEVLTWEEIMPELVQFILTDNASGIIMLIIVYLVIGFGILGTVLMMTMERMREFGVLLSIGMKRARLSCVIVLESILLSSIGAVCGAVVAIPVIIYFHTNPLHMTGETARLTMEFGFEPIMPFSLAPHIFVTQALTVLAIALVASLYPVLVVSRMNEVDAIRRG